MDYFRVKLLYDLNQNTAANKEIKQTVHSMRNSMSRKFAIEDDQRIANSNSGDNLSSPNREDSLQLEKMDRGGSIDKNATTNDILVFDVIINHLRNINGLTEAIKNASDKEIEEP